MSKMNFLVLWCLLLFVIKLAFIVNLQCEIFIEVHGYSISLQEIISDIKIHGMYIEPIALLISLSGFLIRRPLGMVTALFFPYFVLSWFVMNTSPYVADQYEFASLAAQISWPLAIILPLGSQTGSRFFLTSEGPSRFMINLIAIAMAALSQGLFYFWRLY